MGYDFPGLDLAERVSTGWRALDDLPGLPPADEVTGPLCAAMGEEVGLVCTREEGHASPHAASGLTHVLGVWE